jgi:hypothetical protein
MAARADRIRKIRTNLGLSEPSGMPQANLQPAGPTNPQAGLGPQEDFDVDGAVKEKFDANRDSMLAAIKERMGGGQDGTAPGEAPTAAPSQTMQTPDSYLKPETEPLAGRLANAGATSASPSEQFARLAGRLPSPRELAVFQGRALLEGNLGRPPTPTELKLYMMRDDDEDSSFPRAF